MSTEEFITKSKEIHGNRYDYSKTEYINAKTKVCIICPEHGEFYQRYSDHLNGCGCRECSINKLKEYNSLVAKSCSNKFIEKAKKVHGDKYDYSKVEYINSSTKICIICPRHGEFWQKPNDHLSGYGCPKCAGTKKLNNEEFIEKAKKVHGDKYGYSKVEYINSSTKICIICPEHGEFWQTPHAHLSGQGCSICGKIINLLANQERFKESKDSFVERAKKIHGDRYDYSKIEYKGAHIKICIICPEHGEFWQTPHSHLNGCGCPICKESKLEKKVRLLLINNNINFRQQMKFDWLGKQSLDFYLPDYNIAIECQGRQHFEPVDAFGGKRGLIECEYRDSKKYNLCKHNKIDIIYFSTEKIKNISNRNDIITDASILIAKIIKEYGKKQSFCCN